jgi:hypothetical protein
MFALGIPQILQERLLRPKTLLDLCHLLCLRRCRVEPLREVCVPAVCTFDLVLCACTRLALRVLGTKKKATGVWLRA